MDILFNTFSCGDGDGYKPARTIGTEGIRTLATCLYPATSGESSVAVYDAYGSLDGSTFYNLDPDNGADLDASGSVALWDVSKYSEFKIYIKNNDQVSLSLRALGHPTALSTSTVSATTEGEHYSQLGDAIQTILKDLDGYGIVQSTAATGDGYMVFFTSVGRQIAGDNDVFWDRENSQLKLNGTCLKGDGTAGNLLLTDNAETAFGLIQLGGTTSSFPAIKRSDNRAVIRTADDGYGIIETGGMVVNYTEVSGATYSVLETDYVVGVTRTVDGTCIVSLPTALNFPGRTIVIKDAGGNATSNNITIDTGGEETIDGAAEYSITNSYDSITLVSTGDNWLLV